MYLWRCYTRGASANFQHRTLFWPGRPGPSVEPRTLSQSPGEGARGRTRPTCHQNVFYIHVGWITGTSQGVFRTTIFKGPFKNDVTAKMTISTTPSLPCHCENNRICNLKQWKSPFLLTSLPPFPGDVIFERPLSSFFFMKGNKAHSHLWVIECYTLWVCL